MAKNIKGRDDVRSALLAAASKLVRENGVIALTLDATAKEAGISKGGLLYHFPTKEALIGAMVEDFGRRVLSEIEEMREKRADEPGSLTQAVIEHTERHAGAEDQLPVALIAALGTNPALLAPARSLSERRFEALRQDGIAFEIAAIINLAADGLWFTELLGMEPLGPEDRARVFRAMRKLVDVQGGGR
jgi:AcrR family transcriptional regulator